MRHRLLVRRWVLFNGIGTLGVLVQLGTLAVLVAGFDLHYLPATAVAVEAAVLHNFVWHQYWTWRDRPAISRRDTLGRLGRFQVLNGAVSLVGNLALMALLTGMLAVHPILANVLAILTCSIVNFFASEVLVFRRAGLASLVVAMALSSPAVGRASADRDELRPGTVAAWNQYERMVDERYRQLQAADGRFFAHDEFGSDGTWRTRAMTGEVVMLEISSPTARGAAPDVPDGRVHHWAGAVFVPGTTTDAVVQRLKDTAGHESKSYEDVLASRLLSRNGDSLRVFMKLRRTSIITVTYNTEHAVEYRRLGPARASSRSVATKIAELADPGTATEREKPDGSDRGFLWRLNAYWRYEQVGDGVLIECESVSLSRGIPVLLRPFVTGTVERIARESLERTLASLRRVLAGGSGSRPSPSR
jgi:putative flippase GtrA